jgi:antitoxin ParD1/3/4
MTVTLTAQLSNEVQRWVDTGEYSDADAVMRDALSLLKERRAQLDALRAKLQVGIDQLDRGEGVLYSPQLLEEIDRDVDERLRRGEQPNPDVCP